jgi:hypothetical protein
MALVSRSARRGGVGRRWLLIGIVITLFVLLIDASLHSRSSSQQNELATGAWVDRALPIVTTSTEEGQRLAAIWTEAEQAPGLLTAQLDQIATGAAAAYQQAVALRPPVELAGAAGLLDACLLSRSEAASAVRNALEPILSGTASTQHPAGSNGSTGSTAASAGSTGSAGSAGSAGSNGSAGSAGSAASTGSTAGSAASTGSTAGSAGSTGSTAGSAGSTGPTAGSTGSTGPTAGPAGSTGSTASTGPTAGSNGSTGSAAILSAIQTVGDDLQISDQAYHLFLHSLPDLGVPIPNSYWAADMSPYQPEQAQLFLATLQNAMSATPVHQVRIDSVTTSPASVSAEGSVRVLPDSQDMSVTVVLSDTGNQPENNLTVTASIAPGGGSSSVRDFVNLSPGQAQTVQGMGPLNPVSGAITTLTVTVTPTPGSGTPAVTQTLRFTMPAFAPSSTTRSG